MLSGILFVFRTGELCDDAWTDESKALCLQKTGYFVELQRCTTGGANICHTPCTGDESYYVTIYEAVQMYVCKARHHEML